MIEYNYLYGCILCIRCFAFPKILTMGRIIRVIIKNSSYQNINREEVKKRDKAIVYILGKSKHLIAASFRLCLK